MQTDFQFYALADLPDSPYEGAESSMETMDDEFLDGLDSSDDGFWSEKAYSV